MNPQLSAACEMFLVPISILFIAIAVARTEALKAAVSATALGISLLWVLRVWTWKVLSMGDRFTTLALAVIFVVATALSLFIYGSACVRHGGVRAEGFDERRDLKT